MKVTICPPMPADGLDEQKPTVQRKTKAEPDNPNFYTNSRADGIIHIVGSKDFFMFLDPKRLNRLDVIKSKAVLKILEGIHD